MPTENPKRRDQRARSLRWRILCNCLIFATLCLSGCKRPSIDVDAVNALVAGKHTMKLKFVQREVTSGTKRSTKYLAAVPKGWTLVDGHVMPEDKAINGYSSMTIGSSCDAEPCERGDWNAAIDKKLAENNDDEDTERDERASNRRVVFRRDRHDASAVSVYVFWWKADGTGYHACKASLDRQLAESAAAFEKACESVVVLSP